MTEFVGDKVDVNTKSVAPPPGLNVKGVIGSVRQTDWLIKALESPPSRIISCASPTITVITSENVLNVLVAVTVITGVEIDAVAPPEEAVVIV